MAEISIIVPVYNVEKYIRHCIDSLIAQTFKSIEILLIDDGSTDNSGIICDEYALTDDRIKVIHKSNGGVSSARNAGLDDATGTYIMFCDPDDYVEPMWCEEMHNVLQHKNICFCVCGFNKVHAENRKIVSTSVPTYPTGKPIVPIASALMFIYEYGFFRSVWSGAFRADIIYENKLLFHENFSRSEDTLFVLEYLMSSCDKVGFVDKALYNYCVGINTSLTHKVPSDFWETELLWLNRLQELMNKNGIASALYREKYYSYIIDAAMAAINTAMMPAIKLKTSFRRVRQIISSKEYKEAFKYGNLTSVHPLYRAVLKSSSVTAIWIFHQALKFRRYNKR